MSVISVAPIETIASREFAVATQGRMGRGANARWHRGPVIRDQPLDGRGNLRIGAITADTGRRRTHVRLNIPGGNAGTPSACGLGQCWRRPGGCQRGQGSATGEIFITGESFFMSGLLLTMIAPSLGPKRTAASSCATDQHFERECGLLRLADHDYASGLLGKYGKYVTTA